MAQKTFTGKVVSLSEKTANVEIVYKVRHPKYLKTMTKSRKFLAHDEAAVAKVGDQVEIIEIRPVSKRKAFKINKIIEG